MLLYLPWKIEKIYKKSPWQKLTNALQDQEQMRLMRSEDYVKRALQANLQNNQGEKEKRRSFKKNFNQVL